MVTPASKLATGAGGVDGLGPSGQGHLPSIQAFVLSAPVQKAQQLKEEETDTENTLPSSSAQYCQTPRCQAHGAGTQGHPAGPQVPGIGEGAWRVAS